jgi:hypothetical protein
VILAGGAIEVSLIENAWIRIKDLEEVRADLHSPSIRKMFENFLLVERYLEGNEAIEIDRLNG